MEGMLEFEEFLLCPNCKQPLIRKSTLKKGCSLSETFCGKCGISIARMLSDIETDNVISRRYEKVLSNSKNVSVSFSLKEECHEEKEFFETLNFIATSAHRFYLDVAEQIKNRLS